MGKHAIIVIKNQKNEYLQYYDNRWNSYLFPNCKMNNKDDIDSIIQELQKLFKINKENIKYLFVGEKKHIKYSESAKKEKEYIHYFYKITFENFPKILNKNEFENENIKFKWFSIEELKNNEKIQKVNKDIISYIKELNL